MPAYELAFPPDAYAIKLRKALTTRTYPIDKAVDCFTRTGEDDDTIILALFGGDEFVGEVLEGHWKKGWDANMNAAQAFTAIINGSGTLEFEGEADAAGTYGYGWINSHLPLPLLDELELQFSMEVPVDDTGGVAARDIQFSFYLRGDKKPVDVPNGDADFIRIVIDVDEDGLLVTISREVNGTNKVLFTGSDYTEASTRTTGDLEGMIWRIVFHDGHFGAASPSSDRHIHVYLKQSDTIANAESATENQLDSGPYDISDLLFEVAYPAFEIGSQNTTYYDSGNEAKSTYVKVSNYPDFDTLYDIAEADRHKDEVELWDGDPASGGVKVYDVDHQFSGDPYLQNGILRVIIDEGERNGFYYEAWDSDAGGWVQQTTLGGASERHGANLRSDSISCMTPYYVKTILISPEKIVIQIKLVDYSANDDDYYAIINITIRRGILYAEVEIIDIYPLQHVRWQSYMNSRSRFGYAGDNTIGDDDLSLSAINATMTDNFLISFRDDGQKFLLLMTTDNKPDSAIANFEISDGRHVFLEDYLSETFLNTKIFEGFPFFSLVTNLFIEAEDADLLNGASSEADGTASGGNRVKLDAQDERIRWQFTAGTNLPAGRYLAVFRAYDLNQVASDLRMHMENATDAEFRNEENTYKHFTLTAAWAYYSVTFDISDADVSGTDTMYFTMRKATATANEIYVDYFLIIPIGDGESFPQDLAHAALRDVTQARRLFKR